ncbi:hypothetical protein M406DRAFT_338995 [Cryphonectria parasitica EP155]|uniref:Gas1-like protein n=1 Tax=Cryphonectria parasitica (strain ATCC 38755 / EP155) TaxID=660469 RepID=A0A9P5CPV1_CRYP1|nr:uncharacterized protein M406DRAFT_338995 [Cryphonectria parasitica EP155]KAF3765561.1 hypothetical protein M406DRAFT_338995 [Cryphonectria parasitica EP155]
MPSVFRTLFGAAMLGMVHSQGVVLKAVGNSGTSLGLLVDSSDPNDANFISDAEISANVVNECGRTFVGGNIDIGANTEDALAAGNVTQVTKGSNVKITIDQRSANGTGPFTCDMDQTGNSLATGQTALTVAQDSTTGTGQTTLTVTMPADMACQGSSQGNVCTVRCRNAEDFGGCVAVQQTDVTALPGDNAPSNITTAATLADVEAQVQQNQKDLPAAIAGNDEAAASDNAQSANIAQAIIAADPAVVQSETAELATKAASASTAAATDTTNTNGKSGKNKNGKGKNNKRESRAEGRKRIVNVGVDYAENTQN